MSFILMRLQAAPPYLCHILHHAYYMIQHHAAKLGEYLQSARCTNVILSVMRKTLHLIASL